MCYLHRQINLLVTMLSRSLVIVYIGIFSAITAFAQKNDLNYYLPAGTSYDPAIPTPAQFLGYEVGEWHATHDQLLAYMRELDRVSERITLRQYGRSHENRPLVCLIITDPANHSRLERIRQERLLVMDPERSSKLDVQNMPAVNYMGYSIHGNEASGSNAALVVAYHLAAAQSEATKQLLQNTIILLDPCFNPDGLQRFSSWVNSHRSQNGSHDPAGDEFNEPWPQGRTNHYGFDLNRDWLVMQQPESRGRVAILQEWKPNVLTDHHEMGSNSTFFFQPGVPSRVNPITPARNQELTAKIASYHAKALSEKNILFFTGESFDDFYYGKGSTYPDVNGCIGILFEQGSSRGSAQETENGLLTFPYSIRNQVLASFSTLEAVKEMRTELNTYLRDFYRTAVEEARREDVKGYVFGNINRDEANMSFLGLLMSHGIDVRMLKDKLVLNGQTYHPSTSFWVPCEQAQYRLIRGIFERQTKFQDSVFYDISAWTLPDAYGLQWSPVRAKDLDSRWMPKEPGIAMVSRNPPFIMAQPAYAYVYPAVDYLVPTLLVKLQKAGIRVKLATEAFETDGHKFEAGSIVVFSENQAFTPEVLLEKLQNTGVDLSFTPISNGLTPNGPDLGSAAFATLRTPKVLLLTGQGVNVAEAGEIWHLLDTRYGLPVTLVDVRRAADLNLQKYNVLVLADGSFGSLPIERVRDFVSGGGTLIATGASLKWLKSSGLMPLEFRNTPGDAPGRKAYGNIAEDLGARNQPGAIFEAVMDRTHPLCFGYERDKLAVFLSDTLYVEPSKNPYATPVAFTRDPLLAGYLHPNQKPLVPNAAAVIVGGIGRGRIIGFSINPNFRAFWYGTNRLFANAVFFGNLISGNAIEKK